MLTVTVMSAIAAVVVVIAAVVIAVVGAVMVELRATNQKGNYQ